MKYILVWWVISVGHSQNIHIERGFESQSECEMHAKAAIAGFESDSRWRCSVE